MDTDHKNYEKTNQNSGSNNHKQHYDLIENEPELFDYIRILVKRRWLLIIGTMICITVTGIFTKLKEFSPLYEATSAILPSPKSDYLKTGIDEAQITQQLYPKIMQSTPFKEGIVKREYTWENLGDIQKGSLVDALSLHSLEEAVGVLSKYVSIETEREGIIRIKSTTPNPLLSAQIANNYAAELKVFNSQMRNSNAKHNLEFIEQRLDTVKIELKKAEEILEQFYLTHRELGTLDSPSKTGGVYRSERISMLKVEKDRLEREVTFKEKIYSTLSDQFELAKIEAEKDIPTFTVLENAIPPKGPKSQNVRRNLAIACLVGLFFSITLSFIMEYIEGLAEEKKAFFRNEITFERRIIQKWVSKSKMLS